MRKLSKRTFASQLSSTLMQLLFSFDRGTRVEKTLMQTLASQLSCNSCSRLTGARELRKLSCKLSLLDSYQLSCEKTLMQTLASQLSSTLMQLLFSFDRGRRVEKTLMQTLASQLLSSFDRGFKPGFQMVVTVVKIESRSFSSAEIQHFKTE